MPKASSHPAREPERLPEPPTEPRAASRKKTEPKPVLLLLHGFRGNHYGLIELAHLFEQQGYRVLIPDIPPALALEDNIRSGVKDLTNDQPRTPHLDRSFYTKDGYADWIADYIDRNHLERPVLIGHSMGSIIGAAVAEKYPEKISDKIIFLAPISAHPPRAITNLTPFVNFLPNKLVSFICTEYLIVDRRAHHKALHTTYSCSKYAFSKKELGFAAQFSSVCAISDFNFHKKALFLAGTRDHVVSEEDTKQTAQKFGAKCVFLRNRGHLLNYESPTTVVSECIKFIEGSPATPKLPSPYERQNSQTPPNPHDPQKPPKSQSSHRPQKVKPQKGNEN